MSHLFLGVLVLSLAVQLGAQTMTAAETSRIRADIDAKGMIAGIVHLPDGRNLRGHAAPGPLYAIELAEPAAWIRSEEASGVQLLNEPDGVTVIEYKHDRPVPLTVRCRIGPDGDTDYLVARISIDAQKPVCIASVTFPVISLGLPMSGTGEQDRVVMPECDGVVFVNPMKNGLSRDLTYPGSASMQLIAAHDDSAGIYLVARDAKGYRKMLSAKRRETNLELSIRHILPQVEVTQWSLPYDIGLTSFSVGKVAGWEVAGDLYRAWALQQPWCQRTLKQRVDDGDVPNWLIEPSLFYAFSLTGKLPADATGQRISAVPDHANAWRQALGGPVTFMLMTWEKNGPWVAPDYFPPIGDAAAFAAATKQLHNDNHRTLVFLSGLNWTLQKTARGPHPAIDDQAAFAARGRPHAIALADGEPAIYGKPAEDVGQFARICPTTPLADELISGAVGQCQELGIDCVQADQLVGGGSPACFSSTHPHPPGGGNWSTNALYQLFDRARSAGKRRSRDFAFAIEEPGEFYIPVLDTYHARDYQQNRWPRWGKGVVGVPLFTHVYHDYLHGYGGDSAAVSSDQNDVALYHQAMNLVCGKAPAVCAWTEWKDPASIHVDQQRMLRNHFDLWRGPAGEFLIFGKRLSGSEVDSPTVQITFTDWPSRVQTVMEVPSILQSTWALVDGRRAVVMACIGREPVTIKYAGEPVTLRPGETWFREITPK